MFNSAHDRLVKDLRISQPNRHANVNYTVKEKLAN